MKTHRTKAGAARGALVLGVMAAFCATAGSAAAQVRFRRAPDYRLEFHALNDATCPKEGAFRRELLDVLGHDDALDPQGRHVVRVIVRKKKLYEVTAEVVLPDGRVDPATVRLVQGTSCEIAQYNGITAAAALIAIVPWSDAQAKPVTPSPPACDEHDETAVKEAFERGRIEGRREAQQEHSEEPPRVVVVILNGQGLPGGGPSVHPPRMTWPFAVSASGLISIGYTLEVAPGFAVGAEWRPAEMFSLHADVRVVLPTVALDNSGTLRQDVGLYTVMVSPCFRWSYFLGCGALDIGSTHVPRHAEAGGPGDWWFRLALGPRLGVDVPFAERFSVRVMADLLFPTERVVFSDRLDLTNIYETPVVSGFLTAGLTVGF